MGLCNTGTTNTYRHITHLRRSVFLFKPQLPESHNNYVMLLLSALQSPRFMDSLLLLTGRSTIFF